MIAPSRDHIKPRTSRGRRRSDIIRLARGREQGQIARRAKDALDPVHSHASSPCNLIESDPALSRPLTDDPSAPNPGAADWLVACRRNDVDATAAVIANRAPTPSRSKLSRDSTDLPSDVGSPKSDISLVEPAIKWFWHYAGTAALT